MLDGVGGVHLIEPPNYADFVGLMKRANLVLTDSGGVQEEAPSLGIPVLVLRRTTERPEGVAAGTARLIGVETECIVSGVTELLTRPEAYRRMARAINPDLLDRNAARTILTMKGNFRLGGLTKRSSFISRTGKSVIEATRHPARPMKSSVPNCFTPGNTLARSERNAIAVVMAATSMGLPRLEWASERASGAFTSLRSQAYRV